MKLEAWMKKNKLNAYSAGEALGVSHTTVYRWLRGTHTPPVSTMVLIEERTNGKVKPKDWLP